MRALKIIGVFIGIPLGAFVIGAIALEISERNRSDQSYARSIGQSEAGCPGYVAERLAAAAVLNKLPVALGRRPVDFLKVAEEQCAKRVPW
jgi:hypothetical protein